MNYPTGIVATVDGSVAALGAASNMWATTDEFSTFGRTGEPRVIGNTVFVPGSDTNGRPFVTKGNLSTGVFETIVFEGYGKVSGVFEENGELFFTGGSNSIPNSELYFTYWDESGIRHVANSSSSFVNDISTAGTMVGSVSGKAAYYTKGSADVVILPHTDGVTVVTSTISDDGSFIASAGFNENYEASHTLYKWNGSSYQIFSQTFTGPNGEESSALLVEDDLLASAFSDEFGLMQSALRSPNGTLLTQVANGSTVGLTTIGDIVIVASSDGFGSQGLVTILNSSTWDKSTYSMTELFGSPMEFWGIPIFVTPSGEIGVIGNDAEAGVITVKTFPNIEPTFAYEVDVTGDGIPELTGTTTGSYHGSWVFDTAGTHQIDVKMTSVAGDVFTGSRTVVVAPRLTVSVPASTKDTTPIISWDSVPNVVQTEIWVDNDTTEQRKVVSKFLVGGQTSYTFESDLELGRYSVWIRHSYQVVGETVTGPWSQASTMLIRPATDPPVVTLGDAGQFSWNAVPGATSYRVWVNNGAGSRVFYDPAVVGTSLSIPANLPTDRYTVWVIPQAIHPVDSWRTANGTWSVAVRFSIGATVTSVTVNAGNQLVALSVAPGTVRSEIWLNKLNPWTQKIVYDDNVSGSATSYATSITTPGTYRVWIRSLNASGRWSTWSSPVDFVVV